MYWVYLWLLMCMKQNCEVSLLNTIIFKTPFFMCGKKHCQRHKIQNFKQTSASRLNLKLDQVNSAKLLLILRQYLGKKFFLRSRWEMDEENIFFCGEEKKQNRKSRKILDQIHYVTRQMNRKKRNHPVGSTVHYKMMNCIKWYKLVLVGTGSA